MRRTSAFYVGRIEPEHVVEFLLLHPQFPRSVRFSLQSASEALAAIEGLATGRKLSEADRDWVWFSANCGIGILRRL